MEYTHQCMNVPNAGFLSSYAPYARVNWHTLCKRSTQAALSREEVPEGAKTGSAHHKTVLCRLQTVSESLNNPLSITEAYVTL